MQVEDKEGKSEHCFSKNVPFVSNMLMTGVLLTTIITFGLELCADVMIIYQSIKITLVS